MSSDFIVTIKRSINSRDCRILSSHIFFNMATNNIESNTLFDYFPNEIIFTIFDYLSNNDIMYTFFFFDTRMNNLVRQNQRFYNYLELPTTNLDIWRRIFPTIQDQIKCLNLNTIDLSFRVEYFPNLESLTIKILPYELPDNVLQDIIQSNEFLKLNTFKIKTEKIRFRYESKNDSINCRYLLKKVFNSRNSLKIFQYPLTIRALPTYDFEINFNLQALILTLSDFQDIFLLIKYAPNLKYLNIQVPIPTRNNILMDKSNIKLEKLCLTLKSRYYTSFDSQFLINSIKEFSSSSLTSLTLNLIDVYMTNRNEFPFNIIPLQYLLESMVKLDHFHLYAKLHDAQIDREALLLQFQNQYWLDHNWKFGMHGQYFYTLPFHFDHLYQCKEALNNVQLNNHQIWYNVKSIDLNDTLIYDRNFMEKIKIVMPNLDFIEFVNRSSTSKDTRQTLLTNNDMKLNNVKTIQFVDSKSFEEKEEWLINLTPNLNHLILSTQQYPLVESQLTSIFNKNIRQLDINVYFQLDDLAYTSYIYFSNVEYINLFIGELNKRPDWHIEMIVKILENFQKLIILTVFTRVNRIAIRSLFDRNKLNTNKILAKYQVRHFEEYSVISRNGFFK